MHRPKSVQGTSTSGRLAGSPLYSTVRPRQFIVVPLKKNSKRTGACIRTHHTDRRPPPQATPLPRCLLQPQPHPTTEYGRLRQRPSRPTSRLTLDSDPAETASRGSSPANNHSAQYRNQEKPVSPFVVALSTALPAIARNKQTKKCPAPPVARQRAATALPRRPPRPAHGRNHAQAQLLLRPHSQTSAFVTYPTKVRTGDQAGD